MAGATVLAAEQLGLAQRCLDLTVAYVKERRQFNRQIGSSRRSSTGSPTCGPRSRSPRPPPGTPPPAWPRMPRTPPSRWPWPSRPAVTRRSPRPRSASRCTAASASPGSTRPTCTSSERRRPPSPSVLPAPTAPPSPPWPIFPAPTPSRPGPGPGVGTRLPLFVASGRTRPDDALLLPVVLVRPRGRRRLRSARGRRGLLRLHGRRRMDGRCLPTRHRRPGGQRMPSTCPLLVRRIWADRGLDGSAAPSPCHSRAWHVVLGPESPARFAGQAHAAPAARCPRPPARLRADGSRWVRFLPTQIYSPTTHTTPVAGLKQGPAYRLPPTADGRPHRSRPRRC